LVIPIAYGFIDEDGNELPESGVLEMVDRVSTLSVNAAKKPTPSLFRNFSAPVLAHDSDLFNRSEAGRTLAMTSLQQMATSDAAASELYLDAMKTAVLDETSDPAFRALLLALPSEEEIAAGLFARGQTPDPDRIHVARADLRRVLASHMQTGLEQIYHDMATTGPYRPDAPDAARRSLRGAALNLLTTIDAKAQLAHAQYQAADNMTEKLSALRVLISAGDAKDELANFKTTWKDEPNVLDKWFALQVAQCPPEQALTNAAELTEDENFNWKTPNRFRSLVMGFAQNSAAFHAADGGGYKFITDWLLKLDSVNPQTAARLCTVFETWRRYDGSRQEKALAQLNRISKTNSLSKDTTEMVTRILGDL